jgi:hypothetical protein
MKKEPKIDYEEPDQKVWVLYTRGDKAIYVMGWAVIGLMIAGFLWGFIGGLLGFL